MSNSDPYCELKKFIFDAKDEVRNPYFQVRWVYILNSPKNYTYVKPTS